MLGFSSAVHPWCEKCSRWWCNPMLTWLHTDTLHSNSEYNV